MDCDRGQFGRGPGRRHFRSGAGGILIGGIIIAIGLLLLLDNLHIVRIHDVWRFWPLILVVYGVSRVLESHRPPGYIWGGAIALIGALLLLDNLDIVPFEVTLIWPVVFIAFGVSMLWRAIERKRSLDGVPVSGDSNLSAYAIFGGVKRRIDAKDFKGGEACAMFGGIQLDLRSAAMSGEQSVIDVNAVFGGIEIRVPETWSVEMKGMGIFGGFEDKTIHPKADPNTKTPQLVITGYAIFGGASVEN